MLTSAERRRLESVYSGPLNAQAVLAKCVAGLLVIVGIAVIGLASGSSEQAASQVNASRVATDH